MNNSLPFVNSRKELGGKPTRMAMHYQNTILGEDRRQRERVLY